MSRAVAQGLPSPAASLPPHRRLRVSAERDRRDQAAGRARPDPLRHRFRPAGALPGRVSAGDVPDLAPRSGGCLAGQAGHAHQLLRAVQRHYLAAGAGRAAPVADAVPAAAVQRDRRSQVGSTPAKDRPASTATRTATRTARRTSIPVSARSGSAIASRPCRSAA